MRPCSCRLLAILVLGAASATPAQENGEQGPVGVARSASLEMAVNAGFGGISVNSSTGTWVPFRITLVNQGETLTGRLVVLALSEAEPSQVKRRFERDVHLPAGSIHLHEITACLVSDEDVEVFLESEGRVLLGTIVKVQRRYFGLDDQLDIAVIDTDSTTLNNINAAEVPRSPTREPFTARRLQDQQEEQADATASQPQGPGPGRRPWWMGPTSLSARPRVISSDDMPREFVGWDSFAVVVIGDAPLSSIVEEQAEALRVWVAEGGLLIVTGAADVSGLRASGLDQLLPVEIDRNVTVPSLGDLTGLYGEFESSDPQLVALGRLRPNARLLAGSNDIPLVAERSYGGGLVRFVAFNPKVNPYRSWLGARELWSDLLVVAAENSPRRTNWITRGRRGGRSSSNWGVGNYLFSLANISPPSSTYFIFFLLVYLVVVGPLNYFVLRWKRKLDWSWLTIPAVVIAFTAVSVSVAEVTRGGDSVAADVSFAILHQREGIARVGSALMVMPSTKRTYDVAFDGGYTYVSDLHEGPSSSSSVAEGVRSNREASRYRMAIPLTTWTPATFEVRSVIENHAALLTARDEGDRVVLRNEGEGPLLRLVYADARGVTEPVDLAVGEERIVDLKLESGTTFGSWYQTQLGEGTPEHEIISDLISVVDARARSGYLLPKGFFETAVMPVSNGALANPIAVCFSDGSPVSIDFGRSLTRRSKTFYLISL